MSTEGDPHYWTDDLPAALIAMRHATAAAHNYPPFTVVTGQLPILPSDVTSDVSLPGVDATPQDEEDYRQRMVEVIRQVRDTAKHRITMRELALREYLRK